MRVAGVEHSGLDIPDMVRGDDLHAARVAEFHDAVLAGWAASGAPPPARFDDGVWHWIERNHVCNALLWLEEERAHRAGASDAEVAACKRHIDRHQQARHEASGLLDASLLELFDAGCAAPGTRLHSETPGAIIDRLSMLALQICHLQRAAADTPAARLDPQLKRRSAQRRDLCECLDRLLSELADGTACVHVYAPLEGWARGPSVA